MFKGITTLAGAALLATSALAQALPAPPAPPAPPVKSSPPARADLPSADELIEKAMEAAGGREALESIKTLAFNAEMMIQEEPSGFLDMVASPDGRAHYQGTAMGGQVSFEFGLAGTVGWAREGGNNWRLQSGRDSLVVHLWIPQFLILRLDEWFESRETVERADFKGHDAYRIRFEDEDHEMRAEGEPLYGWFDAESGLLIGVADDEEIKTGIAFEDYKPAGPIKVARTVQIDIAGYMRLKVSDVTIDQADESRLEVPAEVKKLIDAAKDDGG